MKSGLEKLKWFIGKHGKDKTSSQATVSEGSTTVNTDDE